MQNIVVTFQAFLMICGMQVACSCQCTKSTTWDGSFSQFVSGKNFCSQGWGGDHPYVCAGGGAGYAQACTSSICSSGQYTFSQSDGWKIRITQGGYPYRAFAWVKFCNGKPIRDCWSTEPISFSFSFRTAGITSMSAYVKLLFWTDSGNIIGLLPPQHPRAGGQYKLVAFPQDDYPNTWKTEQVVADNTWYHVQVAFTPSTNGVSVKLNGQALSDGSIPVNMLNDQNGPQLGAYVFGPQAAFNLWINDVCVGQTSGVCPSTGPTPAPTLAPTLGPSPGTSLGQTSSSIGTTTTSTANTHGTSLGPSSSPSSMGTTITANMARVYPLGVVGAGHATCGMPLAVLILVLSVWWSWH